MIDRYQYTKQDATKHFQTAVISDYEYSESDYYIIMLNNYLRFVNL